MKQQYELSNIKFDDFTYRLDALLETKSITILYNFEAGNNILTLEGNPESVKNDMVIFKECIHEIDENIIIRPYVIKENYRKVLTLQNLDCANCANKVERIAQRTFIHDTLYVDFATSRFIIETKDKDTYDHIEERLQEVTKQVDRNIIVIDKASKKEVIAPKDKKINKIFFFVGMGLFIVLLLMHYIILPMIDKNSSTFTYINFEDSRYIDWKYWWIIIPCFISYIFLGGDVLLSAFNNIKSGRVFDEKFLMSLATLVAFAIQSFFEAISVMLFYKIGEILQEYVINKSRSSIASLMNIKPVMARAIINDKEMELSPNEIVPGDIILVKPGEIIPLDGVVVEGEAFLDTSALTGESKYSEVAIDSKVVSGSVNIDGNLRIKVEKAYEDSMVAKILDLVENASSNKGKTEKFITKFAKYYTPIICGLALLIVLYFIIIDKIILDTGRSMHECIYPGMIFLVVSCPCALVISVPLSYFGAIGRASKQGILIKGSNYLEQLENVGRIIFDKTGTLTIGKFNIKNVVSVSDEYTNHDIFRLAAFCEIASNHPIAKTIVNAYGVENIDLKNIEVIEVNRKGSIIKYLDDYFSIGNIKKMNEQNVKIKEIEYDGLVIYLAKNKKYIGYIVLEDEIREDALSTIKELKYRGYKVAMLTGDNESISQSVASKLEIEEYYANLTPIDKVKKLRKLKKSLNNQNQIFVGDGVNDAPVLGNCDVGIAMGSLGSDAAIEVADVVLMTDELTKIPQVLEIAKKTRWIVIENIVFALGVKFLVLIFALFAVDVPIMWAAVFADVGVSLIATINSLRASTEDTKSFFNELRIGGKK